MAEATVNAINNPTSTLSSSATSGAASLSVAAPTAPDAWPTTGQFRVLIDTELIVVTAASGSATTLTVVARAAEGTTAAAHSAGANLDIVLTDGAFTATAVRSIAKSGSSKLFGDVTLTPGTNVTLTQVANDIVIAAAAGGAPVGGGGSYQLDFATLTSNFTVTATSAATATAAITGNAVIYDGSTRVRIEVYVATAEISTNQALLLELYDGSTDLGVICQMVPVAASGSSDMTLVGVAYVTPTAGSHTYSVRAWKTSGTATLYAGASYLPAFLRITSDSVVAPDGWTSSGTETWTYASADSPTFTFTVPGDQTAKYTPGVRLKLTQTTVKYFIVTAVSVTAGTTTVTVYGGTDYTLANAAISAPFYSRDKAPAGFPLNPAKWTATYTDTTQQTASGSTVATYYNIGAATLSVPIGAWDVYYAVNFVVVKSGSGFYDFQTTLSTANNTESTPAFTSYQSATNASGGGVSVWNERAFPLTVAAKTSYFLNSRFTSGTATSLRYDNQLAPCVIRAVCAYL